MGDRTAKLSKPDLASIIVQRALATPGVRDELYAQLCKQTTGNYNAYVEYPLMFNFRGPPPCT